MKEYKLKEHKLKRGRKILPHRTPKMPLPAEKVGEEETEERNRHRVPRSRSKRVAETSRATRPLSSHDDPPRGGKPIHFTTYVPSGSPTGGPVSDGAADISGANSENLAIHTGNWYIDMVDGTAVSRFNPTTVFPNTLAGGFCCDQVVLYVPRIDRFVLYMQYRDAADGTGAFRLATASPAALRSNFQTAWTYWDWTATDFGETGRGFDYPDLAFTDTFLIGTTDLPGRGRLVFRINLFDLGKGGTISFDYASPADGPESMFQFSHLCQSGGNTAFWAGHVDEATIRIFSLPDGGTGYSSKDVAVAKWPNGIFSSMGKDGTNWLDAPWADAEISGATRRGDELWLAWTASAGKGTSGGFDFPNPHVRVASIDTNTWKTVSEMQVWNPDYAFAYPFLGTNTQNEIGIIVGWGGKNDNANTAEGIIGDFVVWYHNGSQVTPDRFGDFITIRRSNGGGGNFAAFGYFTTKDASRASGYLYTPYYSVFGH